MFDGNPDRETPPPNVACERLEKMKDVVKG